MNNDDQIQRHAEYSRPPLPEVETVQRVLPVLPIKTGVLFPSQGMPLSVSRPESIAAIEAALAREDKNLVIATQKDVVEESPSFAHLYDIGTVAVVKRLFRSSGALQMVVHGVSRARLRPAPRDAGAIPTTTESTDRDTKAARSLWALVEPLPQATDQGPEVEALQREVMNLGQQIVWLVQPNENSLTQVLAGFDSPMDQVFLLASILDLKPEQEQALLRAESNAAALHLMHTILLNELKVLTLRQEIASQAQEKMTKQQREYVLRQQLQTIRDELGEDGAEGAEVEELKRSLESKELPEVVEKELLKELTRLERTPSAAPDYQLIRSYIEFALELPWSTTTDDHLDLSHARDVLDEDHFDLAEVKDRIVDHLAVMKLNPNAKAPILCFVGPPGVGKTSMGQSIARALGRRFERMSLGGLHDESELRGHRRTYIGAMPGRILQAIRRAEVKNPLLMLDEIDKLGRDFRGDPSAALMEILDPAQNKEFRDNYLNLPFDLSQVFFITTANTLQHIPAALLDRMEVLRVAGYTDLEKRQIARRYLIPRRLSEAGLSSEQLTIPDSTLDRVIRRYTREAGVRELERMLGRLTRKAARIYAERSPEDPTEVVRVDTEALPEMLGPERFFLSEMRRDMGPGVAAGLAWTEAGGDVLYVEAVLLPKTTELMLTGQLGDVMKESARAARSYILSQAENLGVDPAQITDSGAHIHVPAGAIPKDGPSAGVTLVTALVSLYAQVPVSPDTAMTGEITLSGLVLPVGGIKEKVLAADRAGLKRIILPKENERDLRELPDETRDRIEFVFATNIREVLCAALPNLQSDEDAQTARCGSLYTPAPNWPNAST